MSQRSSRKRPSSRRNASGHEPHADHGGQQAHDHGSHAARASSHATPSDELRSAIDQFKHSTVVLFETALAEAQHSALDWFDVLKVRAVELLDLIKQTARVSGQSKGQATKPRSHASNPALS